MVSSMARVFLSFEIIQMTHFILVKKSVLKFMIEEKSRQVKADIR